MVTLSTGSSSSCSSSPPGSWPTLAEVLECRSMPVIGLQSRRLPPSHHTAHCTSHTAHCTNQTIHFPLHTAQAAQTDCTVYTQHSVISIQAHFLPPHSQNHTVHSVHTSCYHFTIGKEFKNPQGILSLVQTIRNNSQFAEQNAKKCDVHNITINAQYPKITECKNWGS